MKKFLMPLIIGLCSCTSERFNNQSDDDIIEVVKVSVVEMDVDGSESRWVYDSGNNFGWQSNDVIGIFPAGKGSQVEFPIDIVEGETAETAVFDGGGWALKAGYTYASYSPYNLLSTKGNQIRFSYANQCRKINANGFDLRENMLKVAPPTSGENGMVYFGFYNIEAFFRMELYGLPGNKAYKSLSLLAEGDVIPLEKEYDIFSIKKVEGSNNPTINDKVLSKSDCLTMNLMDAVPDSKGMILVWMAVPAIGTDYGSFKVLVEDEDGKSYVGNLRDKNENLFDKEIKRNSRTTVKVTDFKQSEASVNGSINSWVSGGDFEATAQ